MLKKILIANRGEIAVRIIKACQEMGIPSVAVYSEADRDSLHVQLADEAVCIGPAPAIESYLNMDRIIKTAQEASADSIHPGYEFLAENAEFARRCEKEKVVFKGDVTEAIKHFPKNINVAATLLLASGSSKVEVCIMADPKVKRNIHCIDILAKEARISVEVENVPSPNNPKTSTMAILSAQHVLKDIFSSFQIGS